MTREEQARDFHAHGSNCSQAVYTTYADLLGLDPASAKRTATPWAGGAKVRCGAVYSSLQIIDHVYSNDEALRKAATEEFERRYLEENDSLDCRTLLANRAKKRKSCRDYVGSATRILDTVLKMY